MIKPSNATSSPGGHFDSPNWNDQSSQRYANLYNSISVNSTFTSKYSDDLVTNLLKQNSTEITHLYNLIDTETLQRLSDFECTLLPNVFNAKLVCKKGIYDIHNRELQGIHLLGHYFTREFIETSISVANTAKWALFIDGRYETVLPSLGLTDVKGSPYVPNMAMPYTLFNRTVTNYYQLKKKNKDEFIADIIICMQQACIHANVNYAQISNWLTLGSNLLLQEIIRRRPRHIHDEVKEFLGELMTGKPVSWWTNYKLLKHNIDKLSLMNHLLNVNVVKFTAISGLSSILWGKLYGCSSQIVNLFGWALNKTSLTNDKITQRVIHTPKFAGQLLSNLTGRLLSPETKLKWFYRTIVHRTIVKTPVEVPVTTFSTYLTKTLKFLTNCSKFTFWLGTTACIFGGLIYIHKFLRGEFAYLNTRVGRTFTPPNHIGGGQVGLVIKGDENNNYNGISRDDTLFTYSPITGDPVSANLDGVDRISPFFHEQQMVNGPVAHRDPNSSQNINNHVNLFPIVPPLPNNTIVPISQSAPPVAIDGVISNPPPNPPLDQLPIVSGPPPNNGPRIPPMHRQNQSDLVEEEFEVKGDANDPTQFICFNVTPSEPHFKHFTVYFHHSSTCLTLHKSMRRKCKIRDGKDDIFIHVGPKIIPVNGSLTLGAALGYRTHPGMGMSLHIRRGGGAPIRYKWRFNKFTRTVKYVQAYDGDKLIEFSLPEQEEGKIEPPVTEMSREDLLNRMIMTRKLRIRGVGMPDATIDFKYVKDTHTIPYKPEEPAEPELFRSDPEFAYYCDSIAMSCPLVGTTTVMKKTSHVGFARHPQNKQKPVTTIQQIMPMLRTIICLHEQTGFNLYESFQQRQGLDNQAKLSLLQWGDFMSFTFKYIWPTLPRVGKVIDFDTWISTRKHFSQAKIDKYKDAARRAELDPELVTTNEKYLIKEGFVKRELMMKGVKAPARTINARKTELQVICAPICSTIQSAIKAAWNNSDLPGYISHNTSVKLPKAQDVIIYTSGMDRNQIGDCVKTAIDAYSGKYWAIATDAKKFDASQHQYSLLAEGFDLGYMLRDDGDAQRMHEITAYGASRWKSRGISHYDNSVTEASFLATRSSGDPHTTLMNSVLTVKINLYLLFKAFGEVVFKHMKIFVCGDDCLIIMKRKYKVTEEIFKVSEKLGYKLEFAMSDNVVDLDYCSSFFLPVLGKMKGRKGIKTTYYLMPKLGNMLSKSALIYRNYCMEDKCKYAAEKLSGLINEIYMFDGLYKFFHRMKYSYDNRSEGRKLRDRVESRFLFSSRKVRLNENSYYALSRRYNTTILDFNNFEDYMKDLDWNVKYIDHPVADLINQKDLPQYSNEDWEDFRTFREYGVLEVPHRTEPYKWVIVSNKIVDLSKY